METKLVIGIDPGKSGAWACFDLIGKRLIELKKFKSRDDYLDISEIVEFLQQERLLTSSLEHVMVVVEKVHSMPGQGVRSMFSFGTTYGILLGMCQAFNVPYKLVTPQTWKKDILSGTKKDKDAAINYVNRMYPNVKLVPEGGKVPHNGLADAFCIMLWGSKNLL
jgi:crossover junction endodeoxyribonuclease RuvC